MNGPIGDLLESTCPKLNGSLDSIVVKMSSGEVLSKWPAKSTVHRIRPATSPTDQAHLSPMLCVEYYFECKLTSSRKSDKLLSILTSPAHYSN